MSSLKKYTEQSVLGAAKDRIAYTFDEFSRVFVSFSGGKDSTVMLHMVMDEAIRRGRTVGVLVVDLEAQYGHTIEHIEALVSEYAEHIDLHWCCLPLSLRNAVSNYEPRWQCWDESARDIWVRKPPDCAITDSAEYPFFVPGMEFEEFVPLWGEWYAGDERTAGFIGIRADESLNRFRTVAIYDKIMHEGRRWTTYITPNCCNVYPIYDWRTEDIWRYHGKHPERRYNHIYTLMNQAGVPLSQQRLCQPYGDDQRKGLWLYHILEPETWTRLIARVNGANSGALYIQETGNISGQRKITLPPGHTWQSFTNLLLCSLPEPTRDHFIKRFKVFIKGWRGRGYDQIPDEAPRVLENKHWAPSWRRLAKVLLRNDWWCKGLGMTQPKSEAYAQYLEIKRARQRQTATDERQ